MNRLMHLFANAGVDAEVKIVLYSRAPDDEAISIMFGKEQVTLDFYDVASLERLRDVAGEGARRLRAVIEANARADATEEAAEDAATDRPVKLDVDVLAVQGAEAAEGGQDAADPPEVLNKFLVEAG